MRTITQPPPSSRCEQCGGELRLKLIKAANHGLDRRKSQKPPSLRAVFRLSRQAAQLRRIEISAQRYRNRHDEPPLFAMLNQNPADL